MWKSWKVLYLWLVEREVKRKYEFDFYNSMKSLNGAQKEEIRIKVINSKYMHII